MFPSGVEEDVMLAVAAAVVDALRGRGRSAEGLEGAGESEGLSKTVSESTSASGVVGLEDMAKER
jgi:hypothetical protein